MTSPSLRARRIASGGLAAALTLGAVSFMATSASADDSHSETVYNSIPAAPRWFALQPGLHRDADH